MYRFPVGTHFLYLKYCLCVSNSCQLHMRLMVCKLFVRMHQGESVELTIVLLDWVRMSIFAFLV